MAQPRKHGGRRLRSKHPAACAARRTISMPKWLDDWVEESAMRHGGYSNFLQRVLLNHPECPKSPDLSTP
jgi:hypothetical protein